jgi:hypothetical protein
MKLTTIEEFNAKNLIFDTPKQKKVPEQDTTYHESNVSIRYPDGTKGPLIMQLPRCFTYGISNKFSDAVDKLTLSIYLGEDRENMSEDHKRAATVLNDIVNACKQYTLTDDVKKMIGQYDLEERDLKGMSFLKPQKDRDTKKPLLDRPPTMNIKFMVRNDKETRSKEIVSKFYVEGEFDEAGNPVSTDPREYLNRQGTCIPVLKIESIFLGAKYTVKAKIFECDIKANDTGFKSLIRRAAAPTVRMTLPSAAAPIEEGEDDLMNEFNDDDEDTQEPVAKKLALMSTASDDEEETANNNDDDVVAVGSPQVVSEPTPVPTPTPVATSTKKVVAGRRK